MNNLNKNGQLQYKSTVKPESKILPYTQAAGGWGALLSVARHLKHQDILTKGSITLLDVNQPMGFDCPGCAWPEKKQHQTFNFCENGAKAVAFEATNKQIGADFFAEHSVSWLSQQSDFYLEDLGRLTEPLRYDAQSDKYIAISWDAAFELIAQQLKQLEHPNQAAFYTSGRTSNEAAFLYQLFARSFGTNNLPDCSNMCHEGTSVALSKAIGLGKGTVTLDDFEQAEVIFSFGHNPGSNHPRMLGTLREASKRGATIVAINPLRERGLERFQDPQKAFEMLSNSSTPISRFYYQVKVGGDYAVLVGIMKHMLQWDQQAQSYAQPRIFAEDFISEHTQGFEQLLAQIEQTDWSDIYHDSGLDAKAIKHLAKLFVSTKKVIICWGMGMTQHRHGALNVHMLANLMLSRGLLGVPGAGLCPIRGHSNVQGDRTMGIHERPSTKLLDRLDQVFHIQSPRAHGLGVVDCIQAMYQHQVTVFIGLGGNFAVATPDTEYTQAALRRCDLTVNITTKLNRSHLVHGQQALILPCLGRTEIDQKYHGPQAITVEDSMSNVHLSAGRNTPISDQLLSEPEIVARMAEAVLPHSTIRWRWYTESYDRIRDAIAQVFDDFHDFNQRVYRPGGFHLPHPANQHQWPTLSGKAQFVIVPLSSVYPETLPVQHQAEQKKLILMSMRSHDQYNTTMYGLDDRYRGVYGQRRVVFMHYQDIEELGLRADQWVDIESVYADGVRRMVYGFRVVEYAIPLGCIAAYYPEINPLVALSSHDPASKTPAYKSIPVVLHPSTFTQLEQSLAHESIGQLRVKTDPSIVET